MQHNATHTVQCSLKNNKNYFHPHRSVIVLLISLTCTLTFFHFAHWKPYDRHTFLSLLNETNVICSIDSNRSTQSLRHAYLIVAHSRFDHLRILLRLLDHRLNDIYVLIDGKVKNPPLKSFQHCLKYSKVYFIHSLSIHWGHFSQIQAELSLLQEATKERYDYYHLLSGVDLPLKTQTHIHQFFLNNTGKSYIGFTCSLDNCFTDRLTYYHFFVKWRSRKNAWYRELIELMNTVCLFIQKLLLVNRLRGIQDLFWKGSNWFSITHCLASHVLSKQQFIESFFRYTKCGDESFLQTIALYSPFNTSIVNNPLRMVDWIRGTPYTFRSSDYSDLMRSDKLFARKFDITTDATIIRRIAERIQLMQGKELHSLQAQDNTDDGIGYTN